MMPLTMLACNIGFNLHTLCTASIFSASLWQFLILWYLEISFGQLCTFLAAFWIVWICDFIVQFGFGLCLCHSVWNFWTMQLCLTPFEFVRLNLLCISILLLQAFFILLCELGEIPWFAERANWFQPVAFNDEPELTVCL